MKLIEEQEKNLVELIQKVIIEPTKENIKEYLNCLNILEYSILVESEKYNPKTPEYFNIRKEAFSTRTKYAKMMLNQWVSMYKNLNNCPHSYQDTLSVPFQKINKPENNFKK